MSASAAAAAAAAGADADPGPYPGIDGLDQRKHIVPMNQFLDLINMELRYEAGAGAGAAAAAAGVLRLVSKTGGIKTDDRIRDRVAELLWYKLESMGEIIRKLSVPSIKLKELTDADETLHRAISDIVNTIEGAAFKNSFEKLALTLAELQARVLLRECPPQVPCVHPEPEKCTCPDPKPIIEGVVDAIDAVSDKVGRLSQTVKNIDAKADEEAADAAAAAAAAIAIGHDGKNEDNEDGGPVGAAGTGRGIDRYKSTSPVRGIQGAEEAVASAQDALSKANEGRDKDVARKALRGAEMTLYDLQRRAAGIAKNNDEVERLTAEIKRLEREQEEEQQGGYHYKYIKYKTKYNALRQAMQSA